MWCPIGTRFVAPREIDLAAVLHGGRVVGCSDMFFGSRNNLIMPGEARTMAEGWETKRRRTPGHDWTIVRLGAAGTIARVEVDTRHFKGNAPAACSLEACARQSPHDMGRGRRDRWRPLLPRTALTPDRRHTFRRDARYSGVTHVRFNIFPDGGVAVCGCSAGWRDRMTIDDLNRLRSRGRGSRVRAVLRIDGVGALDGRRAAVREPRCHASAGDAIWASLAPGDWLEAFAAHPKIGEQAPRVVVVRSRAVGHAVGRRRCPARLAALKCRLRSALRLYLYRLRDREVGRGDAGGARRRGCRTTRRPNCGWRRKSSARSPGCGSRN